MKISSIKKIVLDKKVQPLLIAGVIILLSVAYGIVSVQRHITQEKAHIAEENRIEQERVITEKQKTERKKVIISMKKLIETGHAETALAVADKNKELLNDELQALTHFATERDLLSKIENTSKWNYSDLAKYYALLAGLEPQNSKYRKLLKGYDRKLQKRLERKLYARAQALPMRNYKANMDIYEELVRLNPNEILYASKYKLYKKKYDTFMKELEKFGDKPQKSADGKAYVEVEKYLKGKSLYPETLLMEGATDSYYTDSGWLVGCNYSEESSPGSKISEFLWFTVLNSTVEKVEESGAYTIN